MGVLLVPECTPNFRGLLEGSMDSKRVISIVMMYYNRRVIEKPAKPKLFWAKVWGKLRNLKNIKISMQSYTGHS